MNDQLRILITRQPREHSTLRTFCNENHVILTEQSFISTVALPQVKLPPSNWIFLSSPTASRIFCTLFPDALKLGNLKFAAVGPSTAAPLIKKEVTVQFVGDHDLTPAQVGSEFAQLLHADETVVFPISNISLHSVSEQLPAKNRIVLVLYETRLNAVVTEPADFVCFTSPSNVKGFLLENQVAGSCVILCYGDATEKCITELGFSNPIVNLHGTTDQRLTTVLSKMI